MSIRNSLLRTYFARRMKAIDRFRRHPDQVQAEMFRQLIARGADTKFGRRHGVAKHLTPEAFAARVGVQDYESFKPYIERMLAGEKNVAAPGRVTLFARSSGTTSDRSKFIPVTRESVWWNHTLGMRDVAAVYASAKPQTKIFDGKTLTLGGSYVRENGALIGDLSAVLISQTPFWSGWFRAPKMETALIPDFDRKIEGICRECTREKITAFAGVPSWDLVLMRRVLEYTGKSNLLEVWPDLEFFAHGGVAFTPYRKSFAKLIPSEGMTYLETYNASEGFFALADDLTRDDMLLMLDYGTYYEFRSGEQIVPLEGVRVGEVYAMIVTSINGLWRYEIGDTVEFTSTNPYRIRFAGRTRQFINVFGEELIVDNAERALAAACEPNRCGGRRVLRGALFHGAEYPGSARMGAGVFGAARYAGAFCRSAGPGASQRQFGLRRQAADGARSAPHPCRAAGNDAALVAEDGQEQAAPYAQRPYGCGTVTED